MVDEDAEGMLCDVDTCPPLTHTAGWPIFGVIHSSRGYFTDGQYILQQDNHGCDNHGTIHTHTHTHTLFISGAHMYSGISHFSIFLCIRASPFTVVSPHHRGLRITRPWKLHAPLHQIHSEPTEKMEGEILLLSCISLLTDCKKW